MPTIPFISIPEGPGPQQVGVRANPGMYEPLAEAGDRMGGALQGIGQLGFHIKNVYDDAAVTKASTQMQAAQVDFQNSLLDPANPKNGDPSTYAARWDAIKQKTLDGISRDPAIQGLSQAAQLRLSTVQADVMRRSDQQVIQTTREKMVSQAVAVNTTGMNLSIQAGDTPKAMGYVDYMEQHGLMSPEQAGQHRTEIPRSVDLVNFTKVETMDPLTTPGGPQVALKALQERDPSGNYANYTHMTPQMRQEAEFHASRTLNIVKSQIANQLNQQAISGEPPDRLQIEDLVTRNLISRTDAKMYLKQPAEYDNGTTSDLISRAIAYDPNADPKHEEYAKLSIAATDKSVPESVRAEATRMLNERFKAQSGPTNSETFKLGNKILEENFSHGVYGRLTYRVMDPKTGQFTVHTDKTGLAASQKTRADAQTALINFVQQNPQASPKEVQDFVQQQSAPHVEAAVSRSINNPNVPQTAQAVEEKQSKMMEDARAWAAAHPNDPRAARIRERLK